MKVCLDTNVLLSGFTARGLSADVVRLVLTEHEWILPAVVLSEFQRIIETKFKLPESDRAALLDFFADTPTVAKPRRILPAPVIRDVSDAWVLASAVAGGAEVLVTGDQDLLVVAADSPIPVLTPREFYRQQRGL